MTACLLALDTSTPRAVVALTTPAGATATLRLDPAVRHGRALVPALRNLLIQEGLRLTDLDALVVGLGPGSYTGLRIGLTAAKTLAFAVNRPLVGIDSLELVARNAPADALLVSAIGDAQRGDLYVADFRREAPGAPLLRSRPTRVEPLVTWAGELSEGALVVGPALAVERLARQMPARTQRLAAVDADWPAPARLAELAREAWASGRRDDPWFLEPVYLRRSAAEEQWENRPSTGPKPNT